MRLSSRYTVSFKLATGLVALLLGCATPATEAWLAEAAKPGRSDAGEFELGRRVYERACLACHGVLGDGQGAAARFLVPKPRDFTKGLFKFRSTSTGELPTDGDLLRVVARGLPATDMPSWSANLRAAEGRAVVRYIKGFFPSFADPDFAPDQYVVSVGAPPASEPAVLERGKAIYMDRAQAACFKCHGPLGDGEGQEAGTQKDEWGAPINPGNLTAPRTFRAGATAPDIYRTLSTGLNGTPMPGYADLLSEEQRWELALYVVSLGKERSWYDYLLDEPSWEDPVLRQ